MSKLTQFMAHHVLGDSNRKVVFTVVYHETNPNEIRKDGARTCLRSYWNIILQSLLQVRKGHKVWTFPSRPSGPHNQGWLHRCYSTPSELKNKINKKRKELHNHHKIFLSVPAISCQYDVRQSQSLPVFWLS